ncbi:DUF3987 domain-containing protein [Castellaniella hirudinis]
MHTRYGNTDKDAGIFGTCFQGVASLLTSGVAKVARLENDTSMVLSSSNIAIGPSGSGKSVAFRLATAPIKTKEAKLREHIREAHHDTEAKRLATGGKIKAVTAEIGKEYLEGGDTSNQEGKLLQLIRNAPADVADSALMQSNATVQALLRQLARNPVSGLMTAEGNQVLDMIRAEGFSIINSALDGEPMALNRVSSGVIVIDMPLLTVLLLTQNENFSRSLLRSGTIFNTSGLGPRTLCSYCPEEWVGTENIIPDSEADREMNQAYTDRCHDLLDCMDENVRSGMTSMRIIKHSQSAKTRLNALRRQTAELLQSGLYPSCSGFINKIPDHVSRMSAAWNAFEGQEGDISSEYVEGAIEVVLYHLEVHRLLHAKPAPARNEVQDAQLLLDMLYELRRDERPPTRQELQNLAFNAGISSAARFGNALGLLGADRRIEVTRAGRILIVPPNRIQPTSGRLASQPNMARDRFDN